MAEASEQIIISDFVNRWRSKPPEVFSTHMWNLNWEAVASIIQRHFRANYEQNEINEIFDKHIFYISIVMIYQEWRYTYDSGK